MLMRKPMMMIDPTQVGWNLGVSTEPRGVPLWVPFDRTAGVIGPQGSGKTLDLLTPALLDAPGAALVTLTKAADLLLSLGERSLPTSTYPEGRPCVVLDPFGLVEGVVDELVWDPIDGCVDPKIAERRAKAFAAGSIKGAAASGTGDEAARFYAAETAKVLQSFFHAAALTGRNLEHVLAWVANPAAASEPREILRNHPHAAEHWSLMLDKALGGDERTVGNTTVQLQQTLSLFFQPEIRRRCVPSPDRPATDLADIIRRGGTIYMLGREDPYASASPLMTAVAEQVLDTGLELANKSPYQRLTPPLLAVLDELPSTAPLPTLAVRMANERALGLSFIYATQTRAQMDAIFGPEGARALIGLTNNLVMFGGSKDVEFNREVSDLLGTVRVQRTTYQSGMGGRSYSGDDIAILSPNEIRRLPERHALVIAENARPIIAKLHRCIEGPRGERLRNSQHELETALNARKLATQDTKAKRVEEALEAARRLDLVPTEHRSI